MIDVEVDKANLEADAREDMATLLDGLVNDVDVAAGVAEEQLVQLDKQTDEEVSAVGKSASAGQ